MNKYTNKKSNTRAGAGHAVVTGLGWIIRNQMLAALCCAAVITMLTSVTGYAQTGGGAITVYGRSDQDPIRGVKTFINLLMWGMIAAGIVGFALGGINTLRDKPFISRFLGGAVCLGIGGFIALGDRIIKGDTVETPDLLGN